jgi:hypothetical protein
LVHKSSVASEYKDLISTDKISDNHFKFLVKVKLRSVLWRREAGTIEKIQTNPSSMLAAIMQTATFFGLLCQHFWKTKRKPGMFMFFVVLFFPGSGNEKGHAQSGSLIQ